MSISFESSRRGFLGTAAGVAAFAQSAGIGGSESISEPADGLKLGVASYSLREFSRKLAISMTKKLNTPYINIKDVHFSMHLSPEDVKKARAEFVKAGLTVTGGGTITFNKPDHTDIRRKFDYAKAAGMPLIVAAPTKETLPLLEKYVQEYDIKIAVHNHGPEDKHFPTPQSVLDIAKNLDPRIGLCIDIGHTVRTGTDILESVKQAGPRLLDMHIKDLSSTMEKDSQVAVGDGVLPIPALLAQLRKMNYTGGVMLEYEVHSDDPLPGMQKSFAYMRGVLAALAFKG